MGTGSVLRRAWQAGCPSPGHWSRLCEVLSDSCSHVSALAIPCLDIVLHPHLLLLGCPSHVSLMLSVMWTDWEDKSTAGSDEA